MKNFKRILPRPLNIKNKSHDTRPDTPHERLSKLEMINIELKEIECVIAEKTKKLEFLRVKSKAM